MKIFIAEDEPLAAQKLQLFLQKLGERAADIQVYGDGGALVSALQGADPLPDLLFLDIQMPGLTGLDVLRQLQARPHAATMHVIITSAFDQYAIDGFNYGVTDYLLKPYTLDRLRQALDKVRPPEPLLNIRCEGRTERVRMADVVCLESCKDYTQITLADGRQLLTLATLSSFEQQLPSRLFARVQRSYIVGLSHVANYSAQSLTLTSGAVVPIGKTYKETFLQAFR